MVAAGTADMTVRDGRFVAEMLMIVVRILGRLLVLIGLLVLALGLWLWLTGEDITAPAGQLWFSLDVASLNFAQVIVQRHLNLPSVWDDGIVPLLHRPTWEAILWLFLGGMVVGGLLLLIGRSRRRRPSGFG